MTQRKEAGRKKGMARLMEFAMLRKHLIIPSLILSTFASIVSFAPYIAIYKIVESILSVYPDLGALDQGVLFRYGWMALGGALANLLLYEGALMFSHIAAFGTLYDLKLNFLTHLAKLPLGFHVLMGSGKLRKITDENIENIEKFIAHQLPDITAAMIAPVVMLVILLTFDWRLGLASLAGIITAFLIYVFAYAKQDAKALMDQYQHSLEEMNNATVEYIRGISVVKAFNQTVYSFRSLNKTFKEYTALVIPYTLSWENMMSGFTTVVNNIYLFLIPIGILIGIRTDDLRSFIPTFIFYLIFVPAIAGILMKMLYVSSDSIRISNGVETMDAILDRPEVTRPADPQEPHAYDVTFSDVTFSYEESGDRKAIEHVSFTAKQGEVTAIVGPSGGGKSTIAHLIPRFFDVESGAVLIGGVDIRKMDNAKLMDTVSFVFQDVFLFKQSIIENIRMGNPSASDEAVIDAARAAQCHDFIMSLPNGYDTVIGTKGIHLSGGERQRLAIARAIVKDAPIVVLDEATAFADPENEHLIQQAFERLMKDKTVIIIAHRLSTVRNADHTVVMEDGHLIEEGTHDELIEEAGRYAHMYQTYIDIASWTISREEMAQ